MTPGRRSHRSFIIAGAIALIAVIPACVTEQSGILAISVDEDALTRLARGTSADTVVISGQVVRAPPKQRVLTILTIAGGAAPVVDTTTNFGLFRTTVRLGQVGENQLALSAVDDTGAATTSDVILTVGYQPMPSPPGAGPR